jgi:2-dehydrotetronate isomerase
MLRFAANVTMMYTEYPFLERFGAAAANGFRAVEFLFPYPYAPDELAETLRRHTLQSVLFNAPPGDWERGERGLACLPGREAEFRASVHRALEYAEALSCPRIHLMAGIANPNLNRSTSLSLFRHNLSWAAEEALRTRVDVLIEPINSIDIPGYLLNRQDEAHEMVQEIAAPNLKIQMDLYHCACVEGDVQAVVRKYLNAGSVGHIQVAGYPGRNEPDTGELNFDSVFDMIESSKFDGWVGCEYRPVQGTSHGLGWLHRRLAVAGWRNTHDGKMHVRR